MAAVPRQMCKGFGHKGGTQTVFFSDRFDHILKEGMAIGSHKRIGIHPVHLELPVSIFVVVLVSTPAKR